MHKKETAERTKAFLITKLLQHTPHIYDSEGEREIKSEWQTVCVSQQNNELLHLSHAAHRLLAASRSSSLFLLLFQSPNLFSVSPSHSTYCTYLPLVLHHHFALSLSVSQPSTCLSIEYFKSAPVELPSSSRNSTGSRLNLTANYSTCQCLAVCVCELSVPSKS